MLRTTPNRISEDWITPSIPHMASQDTSSNTMDTSERNHIPTSTNELDCKTTRTSCKDLDGHLCVKKGSELVGNYLTVLEAGGKSPLMMMHVCANLKC